MKQRRKQITGILVLWMLAVCLLCSMQKAEAGALDNAVDFYNTYYNGTTPVTYTGGAFYFCTQGKTGTGSIRYKSIGYSIMVKVNGQKYAVECAIADGNGGGSISCVDERSEGGYTYKLNRITYEAVVSLLESKYPGVEQFL